MKGLGTCLVAVISILVVVQNIVKANEQAAKPYIMEEGRSPTGPYRGGEFQFWCDGPLLT